MAKDWSLESPNALQGAAEWLLKKSGRLLVVVIGVDDLAIAGDPQLAPREVFALYEDRLPELHAKLQAEREKAQVIQDRKRERQQRGKA